MFRILIVEDVIETLELLKALISEGIVEPDGSPGVRIHTAVSVSEAMQMIREARKPYHAVVLDFKLPEQRGVESLVDESLCLAVRRMQLPTLVAHITAYDEDPVVKEHLERVHQERVDRWGLKLSKTDEDYGIKLVRGLKAYLYGMRIEEQIRMLFGEQEALSFAGRARLMPTPGRIESSRTHDLAALCRDIVAYWHDLDDMLHGRIRQIFHVDDRSDPVRVSRLRPSENQAAQAS